ncbi:Flavin-dependent tryptophan halogenase RebH [Sphingomonas sp. S2M10]|uniref:tryptophan halogenase family protein n=1 Tax=Sphingomonas sp. S2M10 TaxID=2705010 RepID=UPI001456E2FE|nr:tryptophan halogenase family protein [Sphingomonas sp. S2M10]NLS26158.1 Flavin-dependent tryptophan halogenase RebH [Sphingomonas sp. S2M10]
MNPMRRILILGGGTAGWLTAAYLARYLDVARQQRFSITVLESPALGIVGVGEGGFPTIRETLQFLGIDERRFVRAAGATFKQGIRFDDWLHAPRPDGARHRFLHPFEAPFHADGAGLVPYWLLQPAAARPPFAEAMTIQNRVAAQGRAPKRVEEAGYGGPLTYAYHFDAVRLAQMLRERAIELGVVHLEGEVFHAHTDPDGAIDRIETREHGALAADLYIDCSGFEAALIGKAMGSPFTSVRHQLFTDRALACKLPYADPEAPIATTTIAAAHEAGWTWDIGLQHARGIGCVFSSAHLDAERAAEILDKHLGGAPHDARLIRFDPGYRRAPWVKNCVAVGLSGGFLEPLEATGVVLIEAAAAMIAELFPHAGPVDAPAARFNALMAARYARIVDFLKLHYCLSRREEPFWRDNRDPASIPETLRALLEQWRHRPPSRFDFLLDVESFAFFNYQYILYGMDFSTDLAAARDGFPHAEAAARQFARIRSFGEQAVADLPGHRELIRQLAG